MSRLSEALAARSYTVRVITFSAADSDLHQLSSRVQRSALSREEPSRTRSQRVRNTLGRLHALTAALREFAPHAIVSFMDTTNVYTLLANQTLHLPIIISERVDPRFHPVDRITASLRFGLYGTADGLVLQTQSTLAWARGLPRQPPTYVIPNPVSPVAPGPDQATAAFQPYVLGVGRLAAQKGFDTLIRAFALLHPKCPNLRLVILGEGPERASLEQLCVSLGLSDSVSLLGHRPIGPWLSDALMFVLASRYEGFPNALAEAMAAGLPVVATRCPSGPEEMVVDGTSGKLVGVEDVQALTAAMKRLADDAALRMRLGERARCEVLKRFAPSVVWDAWERAISDSIVHRHGSDLPRRRV